MTQENKKFSTDRRGTRLMQDFTSADGFARRRMPSVAPMTRAFRRVVEPRPTDLFGKLVKMQVDRFTALAIPTTTVNNDGELVDNGDSVVVDFVVLKFKNGVREHFVCLQSFTTYLIESRALMPKVDENGCEVYDFTLEDLRKFEGKEVEGFYYCDERGKRKKLFFSEDAMQRYEAAKQEEFESSMEQDPYLN